MASNKNVYGVYLTEEDYKKIKSACAIVSIPFSTFCRTCAIQEANRILREENKN